MSTANDALSILESAHTFLMVADSEAAKEKVAVGHLCGDQGGPIDEADACSMATAAARSNQHLLGQ